MRYFDTTVLCQRVFGTVDERQAARRCVEADTAITSRYVYQEYLCTFMYAAVFLHQLLVDSNSVEDALKRIDRFLPYQPRRVGRALQVYATLIGQYSTWSHDELIRLLAVWIDHFIVDYFWEGLAQGIDETKCTRCAELPRRSGDIYEFRPCCRADNVQACGIEDFWTRHRAGLGKLARSARQLSDQPRLTDAAEEAGSGEALPGRRCQRLSDAIIVLAAPQEAIICSTDRHFRGLCALFDRALLQPV